jgi:hypothetical protein
MTMARRFSSCTANDRHGTFLDGEGNEKDPKAFEDFVDYSYQSLSVGQKCSIRCSARSQGMERRQSSEPS